MTLYHRFDVLAQRGIGLVAYQVIVRLPNGGAQQPIFGDISGTPIVSTSGIANTAVTDEEGNFSYFVTPGAVYDEEYYSPTGVFVGATRNIPLLVGVPGPPGTPGQGLPDLEGPTGSTLVGYGTRTVSSALGDLGSLLNRGVTGDGITDDGPALAAAGSGALPSGTYRIKTNTVVPGDISRLAGAEFNIDAGVTLTFTGGFSASRAPLFTGAGLVNLASANIECVYPEWFGATSNTGADAYAAIMAGYVAAGCHWYDFGLVDYYTSQTVIFDRSFSRVRGGGRLYNGGNGQCTRFLGIGATVNTLQIGPTVMPAGGVNSFPVGLEVHDIWVARTAAPDIDSGCAAITVQFIQKSIIERVAGAESISNWKVYGCVYTKLIDLVAFRASPGTSAHGTADSWTNFRIGGASIPGAAGANASLYIVRPSASFGGTTPADSVNYLFSGDYTDLFLIYGESTGGSLGIHVNGDSTGAAANNTDLTIDHPKCDQHSLTPILIENVAPGGTVEMTQPYAGPSSGAQAALVMQNNGGSVAVYGGQFVMTACLNKPAITTTNDVAPVVELTQIVECSSPTGAVVAVGNKGGRLFPITLNYANTLQRAVLVVSSKAMSVAPIAEGAAGKLLQGVQVDNLSARCEINCTGIDSDCVSGGSANKLIINGTQVTATGIAAAGMGNNVASGVMA